MAWVIGHGGKMKGLEIVQFLLRDRGELMEFMPCLLKNAMIPPPAYPIFFTQSPSP